MFIFVGSPLAKTTCSPLSPNAIVTFCQLMCSLVFPIAMAIRPQFGSLYASAILTRGEESMLSPIVRACSLFCAFFVRTVMNLLIPSPSIAICLARLCMTL